MEKKKNNDKKSLRIILPNFIKSTWKHTFRWRLKITRRKNTTFRNNAVAEIHLLYVENVNVKSTSTTCEVRAQFCNSTNLFFNVKSMSYKKRLTRFFFSSRYTLSRLIRVYCDTIAEDQDEELHAYRTLARTMTVILAYCCFVCNPPDDLQSISMHEICKSWMKWFSQKNLLAQMFAVKLLRSSHH